MKTVIWNNNEVWNQSHHFEPLLEDITGFNLRCNLCAESVKYMAKRLSDTKYNRMFRFKYSIFENEYKALVEKFNQEADNNGKIEVK
jgi:hypothetical protein